MLLEKPLSIHSPRTETRVYYGSDDRGADKQPVLTGTISILTAHLVGFFLDCPSAMDLRSPKAPLGEEPKKNPEKEGRQPTLRELHPGRARRLAPPSFLHQPPPFPPQ